MKQILSHLICVALFFVFIFIFINKSEISQVSKKTNFGKVIISVVNKNTSSPIKNATICITDTHEYFYTSSLGMTDPIKLECTNNNSYYTLIIYKNGFIPHIYHRLSIEPNTTKTGVIINLEERYEEAPYSYTESYEFPSKSWSETLIKNNKK